MCAIITRGVIRNLPVVISAILSIIGLLAYVVKISMDYSKLKTENDTLKKESADFKNRLSELEKDYRAIKTEVENNKERDEETRKENNKKFNELYDSRNKANDVLTELTTTLKMISQNIDQRFISLEKKIDELRGERKGK